MAAVGNAVRIARYVYLGLILLFLAGVLVQAMLAGRFMFAGADSEPHVAFGWMLAHAVGPIVLLLSFFLRGGRAFWVTSLVWGILVIVQPVLAAMAADGPNEAAAFHVVVALVIFAMTAWLAQRAWAMAMAAKAAAAAPPAPRPVQRAPPMQPPPMKR